MSLINILSPHVADLIAAGEVVERPASVVKELMENSIDAGAKNITVEISGGGMSLVRVRDDGCGMSPEDAGVAFLRHATSKLRDERGLESISTLGFRGEALAAISAVSRIQLRTRRPGDGEGTEVALTAGDIEFMSPVGCPEGTDIAIRELFFNTPARRKFMKSDRAEGSACVAAALRCALGHPEISVRMIKDGDEEFFTPGDGQSRSAVYSLLGRETAMNMLEVSGGDEGVSVSGFVSAPHAGRGNRAMQFFFINGRPFRSASIQAALEQAFKNNLLVGRFPACVLYISLSFGAVDVNVHPTKSEVKFSEEKRVFDAVYYAVLSALNAKNEVKTAEISLSKTTQKALGTAPNEGFFKNMTAAEYRASQMKGPKVTVPPPVQTRIDLDIPRREPGPALGRVELRSPERELPVSRLVPRPEIPRIKAEEVPAAAKAEPGTELLPEPVPAPAPAPIAEEPAACPDYRLIGEALGTYIIVETEGQLLLIDKHAAHERAIFDSLKRGGDVMSQSLLVPVTWTCGAETVEKAEKFSAELAKAGFETEPFGDNALIIRGVPADTQGSEIALAEELLERLSEGGEGLSDKVYHTIACKAAIKAGWKTESEELRALAEKVLRGEVRYCPHGRPVSAVLTRAELDKFFSRIV